MNLQANSPVKNTGNVMSESQEQFIYFDAETNGYLENTTKVHCFITKETSGLKGTYNNQGNTSSVEEGLKYLMDSPLRIVAHNGIKFDFPAMTKVYPWFHIEESRIVDTLVMSRVMFTNLFDTDPLLIRAGKLTPKNIGRHSVEAWGQRVGIHKIGYTGGFESWSQEMEDYCAGDVETLEAIHKYFLTKNYSEQCLSLEHKVAHILARQERRGFTFDVKAASALYAELSKARMLSERDLRETFPPFYLKDGKEAFTPKTNSKKYNYTIGAPLTKVKLTEFNPGSRDHISLRLRTMRGWRPEEFTNDGKPRVDDAILGQLPYPEAKLLARYMMLNKRIGQIAEGNQAWLKLQVDGVIHGGVNTNGAVTGRMTHMNPNLAQVPAVYSPYGSECRALFKPRKGYVLVGADASALELRCLAAYVYPYDKGEYVTAVASGKNSLGTDIHTVNMKALGITERDVAKTWIYAYLYGAGDEKLGTVLGYPKGDKARKYGKESRAKFQTAIPAMGTLVSKVKSKAEPKSTKWVNGTKIVTNNPNYVGYLKGLDGRLLHVRSGHAALNTLLQSAGAVIMKQALVILSDWLEERYVYGDDYAFVVNVHDEFGLEVRPDLADTIGGLAVKSMEEAGKVLNFDCPISGEYKTGGSWRETH